MVNNFYELVSTWFKEQDLNPGDPIDFEKFHDILPEGLSLEKMEEAVDLLFALQNLPEDESLEEHRAEKTEDSNALAVYIYRVSQIPRLSIAEEEELLIGVEQGLQSDIDTLTEAYLPLVLNAAREIGNRREEILEFIQEGNLGLMSAVRKFQLEGSKSFRDFARWHIRKSIHKARSVQEQMVSIPQKVTKFFAEFKEVSEVLRAKLNRVPMLEEIATEMGMELEAVKSDLLLGSALLSKGSELGEEDSQFLRFIKDLQRAEEFELEDSSHFHQLLRKNLDLLPPLEQEIITLHYGLGEDGLRMELHDIADELGLKLQQVSDLETVALQKIARSMNTVVGGEFSF
jgi:RNA polymerase sigma factor (sigma-70 family)